MCIVATGTVLVLDRAMGDFVLGKKVLHIGRFFVAMGIVTVMAAQAEIHRCHCQLFWKIGNVRVMTGHATIRQIESTMFDGSI